MIPTNCGNCVFWDKHPHNKSNWGGCEKIIPLTQLAEETKAYFNLQMKVVLPGEHQTVQTPVLNTRDTFFCAEWVYKQSVKQFTIVDAAREAAKKLKQHKT